MAHGGGNLACQVAAICHFEIRAELCPPPPVKEEFPKRASLIEFGLNRTVLKSDLNGENMSAGLGDEYYLKGAQGCLEALKKSYSFICESPLKFRGFRLSLWN